jgi:hypothetical protein
LSENEWILEEDAFHNGPKCLMNGMKLAYCFRSLPSPFMLCALQVTISGMADAWTGRRMTTQKVSLLTIKQLLIVIYRFNSTTELTTFGCLCVPLLSRLAIAFDLPGICQGHVVLLQLHPTSFCHLQTILVTVTRRGHPKALSLTFDDPRERSQPYGVGWLKG